MNSQIRVFVKNFSYTLFSNIISLAISTIIILIVPKLIGVKAYSYWQLYMFYASYVGFFQFGWNDGIYLRYGGKEYKELDKGLFFSQFWMLTIFQIILAGIIILASSIYISEKEKQYILIMVAACMVILGLRAMILFVLQATNRIKEYAHITIMERVLYCCLIIAFLIFGISEYKMMILADLVGKFISLLYAIYCCKDIAFRKITTFYFSFKETIENISVGIKLMFANIASMLVIGIVRFGIENSWDVSTFGKVSLTLSVSNLMMLFIDAVGIVMFPILRRTNEKKLSSIYITMRDFLMVILFGALILYYPLKIILLAWLPKYSDSLMYMALVFPMCTFEGKMALLVNTYLKTLRKEKLMLRINFISLSLSLMFTFVATILLRNLNLAIVSIVVLLAFRCALAEMYLSKILKITLYKDTILELSMTLIFILSGWFINSWFTVLLYALAYLMYLLIKRKGITKTINNLKQLVIA